MKKFNTKVGQVFVINGINNITPSGKIKFITTADTPSQKAVHFLLNKYTFIKNTNNKSRQHRQPLTVIHIYYYNRSVKFSTKFS